VPKETTGLEIKEKLFSLGRKAADINAVELHEVSVPAANCLSTINQSDNLSKNKAVRQKQTSSSFVLLAAGMVGVAQSAFEHSRRYSKERQTFGKPIAQHQSIAFMMANMAKDIEAARELVWQAAILVDKGCESAKEASAAILFASETVMQVTTDAVQIFGGYGYSKEYPVEKLMRDAKTYQCMLPYSCLLQADLGKVLLEV
jgi:alkylation response protein AidB-like acyl-CoA dehydrogenase